MAYVPLAQAFQQKGGTPISSSSGAKISSGYTPLAQSFSQMNVQHAAQPTPKPVAVQQAKPQTASPPSLVQNIWNKFTSFFTSPPEFKASDATIKSPIPQKQMLPQAQNLQKQRSAEQFVGNLAAATANIPAEASKGAVNLATKHAANSPQQNLADIGSLLQFFLLPVGGGSAGVAIKAGGKAALVQVGKAISKDAIIGGGFGVGSGLQSGSNITNLKDYLTNLWSNTKQGLELGAGAGALVHGTPLAVKNVAIPLAKGASSKAGALFVKNIDSSPQVAHIQLDPKIAQSVVVGNEQLANMPVGKAIVKNAAEAQTSGEHVGITPSPDGAYSLPNGQKVDVSVVPEYKPNQQSKTSFDSPEIIKARADQEKVAQTHLINTPERMQFRSKTADTLYKNGGYANPKERPTTQLKSEKKAFIVTGLPASGKNTTLATPLVRQHGAMLIDKDEAKMHIPESNNGTYNGATHGESSLITKQLLKQAVRNDHNIVMPIVGTHLETQRGIISELNKLGYEVHVKHLEVNPETSAKRAISRFQKTGKFVDPNYILNEVGLNPNRNSDIIKTEKGLTSYEKYTNEGVKAGEKPQLLESRTYNNQSSGAAGQTHGDDAASGTQRSSSREAAQGAEHAGAAHDTNTTSEAAVTHFDKNGNLIVAKNKKVLTGSQVKAIRDVVYARLEHLRATASSEQNFGQGIDKLVSEVEQKANGDKQVLSALRTELNQEMFGIVGKTGNYKTDFAHLQELMTESTGTGQLLSKLDTHIKTLDEKLLATPDRTTQPPAFAKSRLSKQNGTPLAQEPVGEGKLKDSSAFKRLVNHLETKSPEELASLGQTELKYHQTNIADQAEKALEFVQKNPQTAYRVAKGFENAPEGITTHAVNIALADQAMSEKNYALAADLHKSGSLALTRAGQEIVMERGRYSDTSPHAFIKQLISTRLARLGNITDSIKTGEAGLKSAKARALVTIDKEAEKLKEVLTREQRKIKVAQNIIDQLVCK